MRWEAAPTRHGTGALALPPGRVCAWESGRARTNANALDLASQDERPASKFVASVFAPARAVSKRLLGGLLEALRGAHSVRASRDKSDCIALDATVRATNGNPGRLSIAAVLHFAS